MGIYHGAVQPCAQGISYAYPQFSLLSDRPFILSPEFGGPTVQVKFIAVLRAVYTSFRKNLSEVFVIVSENKAPFGPYRKVFYGITRYSCKQFVKTALPVIVVTYIAYPAYYFRIRFFASSSMVLF